MKNNAKEVDEHFFSVTEKQKSWIKWSENKNYILNNTENHEFKKKRKNKTKRGRDRWKEKPYWTKMLEFW